MKRTISFVVSALLFCSCSVLGNINWDEQQLAAAASSALSAVSISDAQVVALSQQTIAQLDAENVVENGSYTKRLNNLMKNVSVDGLPLNYKVYKTNEINAFACGDGSIRVYTGLMDVMNDDELIAILGHEIGHVVHKDTRNAMRSAYLTAAARGVISAAGSVGQIAKSQLGDLGEMYISSQFSQKQEYAADDYGFDFAVKNGHTPYSMYSALNKLVQLSGNTSSASQVQKMFSSHPDSASRAAKMKEKADNYQK